MANRRFGWHSGKLKCKDLEVDQNISLGSLDFGTAELDSIILKGRLSTNTVAGAALELPAAYAYGEGVELRYEVDSWTGIGTTFNGMYLRAQTGVASSTQSIRGMEVYGVSNNHATNNVWGILSYAYIKGTTALTVGKAYGLQTELSFDAGQSTKTITTEATPLLVKITGGVVDTFTKIHGQIIRAGDMDGNSRTYGNGILIEDDADMSGTITWTTGLNITANCTTGISMTGTVSKGINFRGAGGAASASGILMGGGTSATPNTTSTASAFFIEFRCQTTATSGDNRLLYLRYAQDGAAGGGECLRAFSVAGAALTTARGAHISFNVSSTGYVSGLGVGCDMQLFIGNSALPAGGTYFATKHEVWMDGASSDITSATTHAIAAFEVNNNATGIGTWLNALAFKGSTGSGKMILNTNSTGATESNGSIRILVDEGSGYVVRYLRYWDNQNS